MEIRKDGVGCWHHSYLVHVFSACLDRPGDRAATANTDPVRRDSSWNSRDKVCGCLGGIDGKPDLRCRSSCDSPCVSDHRRVSGPRVWYRRDVDRLELWQRYSESPVLQAWRLIQDRQGIGIQLS
jgi:hypothetical protein